MTAKGKLGIIVPTVRKSCIERFLLLWKNDFTVCQYPIVLYLIEDNPEPTFDVDESAPFEIRHLTWIDIDKELGDDSWIIPRRSDTIRSYGIYLAYRDDCEFFITMDDDVYPFYNQGDMPGYFINTHLRNLTSCPCSENLWINPIEGLRPRGYPYDSTEKISIRSDIAISHGLWVDVPDFDSLTSLSLRKKRRYYNHTRNVMIPSGRFFPMCGMNLAWRRDVAPLMYFLLMGQDAEGKEYDYDRFGDIWCGLFAKKIIDRLGLAVMSGDPCVTHERASNAWNNLWKEAPGLVMHEFLWKDLCHIKLRSNNPKDLYREMTRKILPYSPYWKKLAVAMRTWIDLFS